MDDRIKKAPGEVNRSSRQVEADARTDVPLASNEQRRRMFQASINVALPVPPAMPGWHCVWLSTENRYDSIHQRMTMGYELVKADEVKEWADSNYRVKSGQFEGCISVNEMILAKIPEELYQDLMAELHYYAPADEEQRLKESAVLPEKDRNGRRLGSIEGDGFSSTDGDNRHRRAPSFA